MKKNWRFLLAIGVVDSLTHPDSKLMAEPNPIFLNQCMETNNGSVVGVEEQPNKSTKLRGPVPAITAVDENILSFSESFGDLNGSFKDGEDIIVPL